MLGDGVREGDDGDQAMGMVQGSSQKHPGTITLKSKPWSKRIRKKTGKRIMSMGKKISMPMLCL